jgi:hypothetical protein
VPPPNGGLFRAGSRSHNTGVNVLDTQSGGAGSGATRHMRTLTEAFWLTCVISGSR